MLDGIRTLEGPRYARKMHLRPFKKYKALIINRLGIIRTRVQLPPAPPLLIGLQPDSGNKNSHLRTLTRQHTDREKTKTCTCTLKEPQISHSGVFLFVTKGNKNPSPFCTLLASRLFFSQQALYIITVIFKQRSMTNLVKVHKLVAKVLTRR